MVSSCITAVENKVIKSVDISRENAGLEPLKSEEKHNLDLSHELQTMFEMKAFNAKLQKMCSDLWKEVA
jgi:hypothetical protein